MVIIRSITVILLLFSLPVFSQKKDTLTVSIADTVIGDLSFQIDAVRGEEEMELKVLSPGKNLVRVKSQTFSKYSMVVRSEGVKIIPLRGNKDLFEITPGQKKEVILKVYVNAGKRDIYMATGKYVDDQYQWRFENPELLKKEKGLIYLGEKKVIVSFGN